MKTERILECERKRFNKIINFRLPHKFLAIGIVIVAISIISMFIRAFLLDDDSEWLKIVTKQGLILGMLVMSISKDKIEDEMTVTLRSQSYAIAFVLGVAYALIMPYVEFGVSNVVDAKGDVFKELGDFQVLTFMLMIQLMFYHNLKRYR